MSLASWTARAAGRLRAQQLLCQILSRPACTAPPEHRYSKRAILNLPYSIDDTRVLIQYALHGLNRMGYAYAKFEILLTGLKQRGEYSMGLFQPEQSAGPDRLGASYG